MKKDSIASHYKGTAGETYSKGRMQNEINHLGYTLQAKFFTPHLSKKMRVLDFGCGNGSLAKAIEPHVFSVEAIEINAYPREIAIKEQELTVYDGLSALPEEQKYDAIISNHVLEHIPNVIETLAILRSHLVSGGLFLTMLPIDDFRERNNRKWKIEDKRPPSAYMGAPSLR